jgi:hypothetical protein
MSILKKTFERTARFLLRSRRTILLVVMVSAITILLNTLIAVWLSRSHDLALPSFGTIHVTSVEAYGGDLTSVNGVASIDWGSLHWGDSKNISIYLRNTGSDTTKLALNVTDWNPEDMKIYALLSWNYNGTELAPKQEILVDLTLTMAETRDFADYLVSNSVNSFNFTLIIYTQE